MKNPYLSSYFPALANAYFTEREMVYVENCVAKAGAKLRRAILKSAVEKKNKDSIKYKFSSYKPFRLKGSNDAYYSIQKYCIDMEGHETNALLLASFKWLVAHEFGDAYEISAHTVKNIKFVSFQYWLKYLLHIEREFKGNEAIYIYDWRIANNKLFISYQLV